MQDVKVQTNITFKASPILQKYNTKQIQTLFIQFIESLEEQENKEEQVILHKIDYKDMNKKEQEAYNKYKDYSVKDFKKAGFVNF